MKPFRRSFLEYCFGFAAGSSGFLTAGVFLLMLVVGWPLFQDGHLFQVFTDEWRPESGHYGVFPMLLSSLAVAVLSLVLSIPLSLGVSFLATHLAPRPLRPFLIRGLRLMAGIPTVVYGFVAVFLLVPWMRELIAHGSGMNVLTAALVLGLVIAPTMIIFFVSAIHGVSPSFTLAVDALGGTSVQKLLYVVLPQAWPGIFSGVLMGLGRALGDTLISLMIAGNAVAVPSSMADSVRTLTAHIALVISADFSSLEFKSIFACGIALYLFTALIVFLLRLCNAFWGRRT